MLTVAQDPTMRIIVGRRSQTGRQHQHHEPFETEVLTQDGNVEGLGRLNAKWVDGLRVILDMDSSESPCRREHRTTVTLGARAITLCSCSTSSDCEGAKLRAGNVHSAHRWRDVLDPILSRYGAGSATVLSGRIAKPDIYEYLEERRVFYAIRLPSNKVLQYEIAPLLIRPVGRPPKHSVILYDDFWYRAGSWDRARRVVAKVEWHRGELFPRVGFIVTNMTAGPEGVVRFYNGRGTAEQWIKEGKYALNWTRLSCHRFVANRVRLSLFILAYNLGNFLRRPAQGVKHWSLRSVQVKLIKMGGRLVRHSRWFLSVIRGVGSSTVVRGSVGSYRPIIAGAKLREGTTTILLRGRALQGVGLSSMRFHPIGGGPKTMKTDKKHGSRRESHPLSDRPEFDWPCRT